MGRAKISLGSGITVEYGGQEYSLDPKSPARADYTFVSHAHLDHVHTPSQKTRIIASRETRQIALARGYDLGNTTDRVDGVRLLDSGHILGARAIAIGDEVLYTGDAAGRERAFMSKCRTRKARILITESTFGLPDYIFPPLETIVREVNQMISWAFDRGRPVVLMGYPLGKAQILTALFSNWAPIFVHERVAKMNAAYHECGIRISSARIVGENLEGLPRGPFVMVAPMTNSKADCLGRLRKEYGAVVAAFSGWAVGRGYRAATGADFAFALSDHCDYRELLRLVSDVSPETVYTTHGFADEFAAALRKEGYDAKSLNGYQSGLSEYVPTD